MIIIRYILISDIVKNILKKVVKINQKLYNKLNTALWETWNNIICASYTTID